jgi:hypothetical protein
MLLFLILYVVLVLLKIMYTITCKDQLCKTFFALELKGSRFQPWQDFMHMHPRNWPKTSSASNFAFYSSWSFMIVATEKNVVAMGGSPHLHPLIFDQLPVLVLLVRTRSGCPGSWLLFVGLLFNTSCCTQISAQMTQCRVFYCLDL